MGFQELQGRSGVHLGGDDAGQIVFCRHLVDGGNLSFVDHQTQGAEEGLCFLAFPVEIDADGYVFEREGGIVFQRGEGQLPVHVSVPGNSSFVEGYTLLARYGFSFGQKLGIECKGYFKGIDDAHVNFRFFHDA